MPSPSPLILLFIQFQSPAADLHGRVDPRAGRVVKNTIWKFRESIRRVLLRTTQFIASLRKPRSFSRRFVKHAVYRKIVLNCVVYEATQ